MISDRPGAVQGAKRRSEPLTARTDPKGCGRIGRLSQISHFSRILLLLTLALLPRLAQAQRIGPLGPTDRQQSKALSTERTAAAAPRPPSLQLSIPSPAAVALPPLGPDDLQRLQPQEGRPPVIGVHRRLPAGYGHAELLRGGGQDDRRGSVAIDRGRTPLASEDDLSQRPRHAHSLSGLRHRGGQPLAPLGERAGRRALYRLGSVRGRRLLERHRFRRQPDDRVYARWGVGERSRAVPNRGDQPYLGRCFWRRRGGRRPMAAGRVGKLRQAGIAKAAARPDRRCGGNAVEEVAADKGDKGNTVGRAVRLPATAASESGKAAHARTTHQLPLGAG